MNIVYFNAEKFYRLAFDYFNYENNLDLAEKCIRMALKSDKNHSKSIILKGEILLAKNNIEKALKLFTKALKISPDNAFCLFLIAKAHSLNGQNGLALKTLEKIFIKNFYDSELLSECYSLKTDIMTGVNRYKKILHVNF